jgi:zinc protease
MAAGWRARSASIRRRLSAALALTTFALFVTAQALAAPAIQTWTTANGARVLFVPAPEIPMLDVRVVFDAGSARDGDNAGLMNLVNSLLAEGAGEWDADEIAERLDGVGARLNTGSLRDMAWVSVRTLTQETARKTALETMAQILGAPTFETKELERLRESMLAGLRQSEQSPGSVAKKAFYHSVYGDHPYAIDMQGTKVSIEGLRREDVVAAYQRYYVAGNTVIAIVGALDRQAAEAVAEQVSSGLKTGQAAPSLPAVETLTGPELTRLSFPSSQSHIYAGQPGMERGDPDYFPLYVGNHVLGGSGLVSVLSEEVREKRGLSYSVYSYFVPMHRPGPFMMGLQTKNEQAQEALQVMMEVLRKFVREGPSEEALDAAKRNITGGFPLRIASNAKIVEYLAVIGFYGLPLDYLDTFNDKVNAVTAAQIKDAFQRRVRPDRLVTVILGRSADKMAKKP